MDTSKERAATTRAKGIQARKEAIRNRLLAGQFGRELRATTDWDWAWAERIIRDLVDEIVDEIFGVRELTSTSVFSISNRVSATERSEEINYRLDYLRKTCGLKAAEESGTVTIMHGDAPAMFERRMWIKASMLVITKDPINDLISLQGGEL